MADLPIPSDVVERILSGHEPTEAERKASEAEVDRVREIAAQYRACFLTPAGQAVLTHMRSITIEQSAFVPGISFPGADGLSAEQNGFLREGQNSIYRECLRYIAWRDPES